MLFSEIYSTYFNTVAEIIAEAINHSVSEKRMTEIITQKAFSESVLTILPAIKSEEWLLLNSKGETPIKKVPSTPLTTLQKRWLKALAADPRIMLFDPDIAGLEDVEPLFKMEDIVYFDRYADGDPFTCQEYASNFKIILKAIKSRCKLNIDVMAYRDNLVTGIYIPHRLEYSQKDDKFRLISTKGSKHNIINLARVTKCELLDAYEDEIAESAPAESCVLFELTDDRNALERVMLHFSDCRKETQRLNDTLYHVSLWYDPQDETEILIRILSFGQMIKVVAPDGFVNQIKERIFRQQGLTPIL
ncbi:MAG: WYL domain-containing protein [Defluviitaleaceae bacterium]|nr:WYL domain-containing protein [Defluviitaleaceae bacterium]